MIVITHGTLAHRDMEALAYLRSLFAERGYSTLAINLGLGLDNRHGMYECSVAHRHRNDDAAGEIGAWLDWLKAKGATKVVLLGHSYGILYNLLTRRGPPGEATPGKPTGPALVAPVFLLIVSNIEGFLEVLHRRGILWSGTPNFWTWLDIKELNQPPAETYNWIPDRFWWWWRASRVISDYDLKGEAREVISEFPFFSFLHADLHPHVLAIRFILLTIAVALNIFLGGWRGEVGPSRLRLKIHPAGLAASALLLGGLAILIRG